eukprot:TRINITY_DN51430_c0_g1_i1.p1 TRINITY_DN51430_c0_g1~~TRINITY_DN51430_c0_g1_i1.p1  ORF type:complete len:336 (-),score=56.17 TRINITY_DN51430_c0_g1_i1:190-1197(-)
MSASLRVALFALAASGKNAIARCTSALCDSDELGLLQHRASNEEGHVSMVTASAADVPPEYVCPPAQATDCPNCVQFCPSSGYIWHCHYITSFAKSGAGLSAGITSITQCTKDFTDLNETCFTNSSTKDEFDTYARGYRENGGAHGAWMWSGGGTLTIQPNREAIAEYYLDFISRHAKNFAFRAPPEVSDAVYAEEHGACIVDAVNGKPGYALFGFPSDEIEYGTGFVIFDAEGEISFQMATADGSAVQTSTTTGYVQDPPTRIEGTGVVASTFNKFFNNLKRGKYSSMSSSYSKDAKLIAFNAADAKDPLQVFEGKKSIENSGRRSASMLENVH